MKDLSKYIEQVKKDTISQSRPFSAKAAEFFSEYEKNFQLNPTRAVVTAGGAAIALVGAAVAPTVGLGVAAIAVGYAMVGGAAFGGKLAKFAEGVSNLFAKDSVVKSTDKINDAFDRSLASLRDKLSPSELREVALNSQKAILEQFKSDLDSIDDSGVGLYKHDKYNAIKDLENKTSATRAISKYNRDDDNALSFS